MSSTPIFPPRPQSQTSANHSGPDTFIAACLAGRAKPSDAPAWIERWNATVRDETPLQRFMGMTDPEWKLYMEGEGNLLRIIADRTKVRYPAPKSGQRRVNARY